MRAAQLKLVKTICLVCIGLHSIFVSQQGPDHIILTILSSFSLVHFHLSNSGHVHTPECDEYLFLTEYEYQILFGFQKSPNTKYWILFGIEKIQIPNTNSTIWSNYLNTEY